MPYILIFILLLIIELAYISLARRYAVVGRSDVRNSHIMPTVRGGGVVFLFAVWLYCAFFGVNYPLAAVGVSLVGLIGFIDDLRPQRNLVRLVVQFAAMALVFAQLGITSPVWWTFGLIVCVGTVNAYNFMDGINGITVCYTFAMILPLLYLNVDLQFVDARLLYTVCIALVVFGFFNVRKQARCFAGDVGSLTAGFIVVFLLCKLMVTTGDYSYIAFIAVYGVDSVLTICHRIMLHENIGVAHRKHAYQIMANELHIPQLAVSAIYGGLQLLISFGLIVLPAYQAVYAISVMLVLGLIYITFMRRYFHLHQA
jgi:UDP-N-acetylmuramyl pentapeptide phosphotransferase/UDP-N-acetylglucosamine-1-phosphate transferase